MKKYIKIPFVLILCLMLCLLAACGQDQSAADESGNTETVNASDAESDGSISILGAWDDDANQMSIVFNDDGTCIQTTPTTRVEAVYTWDGETLSMEDPESGLVSEGMLNSEGNLIFAGQSPGFSPVDEPSYLPKE